MIKSRKGGDSSFLFHAIIVFLLLLIGLLLAYVFLYKVEGFQGSQTNVIVRYYHLPGCTYCKQFNPEWDKFVSMSNGLATVEKIDGTTQTVPTYVKGFPHVEFVVSGKENEYTGERTANALMDKLRSYQ